MKKLLLGLIAVIFFILGALWILGDNSLRQKQASAGQSATPAPEYVLVKGALEAKGAPLAPASDTAFPFIQYQTADLTLGKDDTTAALEQYGRDLGATLAQNFGQGDWVPLAPVASLIETVETGRPSAKPIISDTKIRYQNAAQELLGIKTPPAAAALHLRILNSITALAEATFFMESALNEPLLALKSGELYPQRLQEFLTALNQINQFFSERQIAFAEGEQIIIPLNPNSDV